MVVNRLLKAYENFSDGWNADSVLDNVSPTELTDALNALPNERGGIGYREGTKLLNTKYNNNPITRVYEVGKPGQLQFINASGGVLRKLGGTIIATGLVNTDFDIEPWNDRVYFVNGDKFYVWNYTTWSVVTADSGYNVDAIHRCKYIQQRGTRLFAAGDPQNPNAVYYSEPLYPTRFKGLNAVMATTDDDDIIQGLFVVGEGASSSILAFKKRSIFAWYGWDPLEDVQWHKQPASAGTVSQRTICQVNNTVYYMGEFGVYRMYSVNPGQIISESLTDPTPNRPGISKIISRLKNKQNACAVFWKRYYMLAVEDGDVGYNNKVLVFDTALDRWVGYFDLKVSDWCVRSDGTLTFGSPLGGGVFQYGDNINDEDLDGNEVPIHWRITTKQFDMDAKYNDKKIKHLYVAGRQFDNVSSSVDVIVKTDYHISKYNINFDESPVWGEGIWGESLWGWSDVITKMIRGIRHRGKRSEITFENNRLNERVVIYGICYDYRLKRAKASRIGVQKLDMYDEEGGED